MSDPQNPDVPTPPPGYGQTPSSGPTPPPPSYGDTPPPAGQSTYSSAPPAPYGTSSSPSVPGKTMGIVAFILSFFIQPIALILGIVALVQSKKAGHKNGWAVAAIIISAVLLVLGIIIGILVAVALGGAAGEYARLCAEYGSGIHDIDGVTLELSCPSS